MITVAMASKVRASPPRVWAALTRPDEVGAWGMGIASAQDVPADYPVPGGRTRWRVNIGRVPVPVEVRPLEVIPVERLQVELRSGLLRMEVTLALHADVDLETQLGLRVSLPNSVPLLGATLDRFAVRELTSQGVDRVLRAVREWCEQDAGGA